LIDCLSLCAKDIGMLCNERKTVCMVLSPCNRSQILMSSFPMFKLGTSDLQFVSSFLNLGHIISNSLSDNDDVQSKIKNTFIRTNILIRKFSRCSYNVKCLQFRSYCLGLYDIALWYNYTTTCINKFRSCFNKCVKLFFGYTVVDTV